MSVVIVGGDDSLAKEFAAALRLAGADVATVGAGPVTNDDEAHFTCDLSSATEVLTALRAAESVLREQPALVRLGIAAGQAILTELASLTLPEWTARAEQPLHEAVAFHQAAQRFLADRSGRIVVVTPTVGLSGGPGYVALATTAEADRSLVKAQARVSGARGITINCVAVASTLLAATDHDPDRSGLPRHALPTPDLAQVAPVVLGLLSPTFAGVTGQTIAVDGGRWMAP